MEPLSNLPVLLSLQQGLTSSIDWRKELGAYRMILGYRNKGHLVAKTNPIRKKKRQGCKS